MADEKWLEDYPVMLPTVGTSGYIPLKLPRYANFLGVLNTSGAQIDYIKGEHVIQPVGCTQVAAGVYLSFPLDSQVLTLFWSSPAPLNNTTNKLLLKFSNAQIPIQGGVMAMGGVANNVNIINAPFVTVQNKVDVDVKTLVALPAGNNTIGKVDINNLPVLPAGANNIGKVDVNALPALPAGNNVIGHVIVDTAANPSNLDVTLSSLLTFMQSLYAVSSVSNSSVGAPLTVGLDTGVYGGRANVEVHVISSNSADFNVYGSIDGVTYRLVDTLSFVGAGEKHAGYANAYRYLKVVTLDANDNTIEIVASR